MPTADLSAVVPIADTWVLTRVADQSAPGAVNRPLRGSLQCLSQK
ncbi:MAG: hypothetical protein ACYDER_18215 [Ktedonobacteraceae bacterium]